METNDVHRRWAGRSTAYSPEYYAYYGPNETSELLRSHLEATVGTDATVLEPGCSAGRHLAHLHEHGFRDLSGIDLNDESFDVLAENYPGLATDGSFYADAIEAIVPEFDDGAFDAVYTVETLQHIPPENDDAFAELARIADDTIVTVENEGHTDGEAGNADDEAGNADNDVGSCDTETEDSDNDAGQPVDEHVSYVDDGIPLYHRRWDRVFETLGFVERESQSLERDTLRVFRRPER
ncbi:class I SAM-dependent methyltransferase [Halobacteria archaeon AArc-dxtr1]|nr:class I SAM-dependent methyltransferase [Halobacteria archaeon AArc-dxtr1]